MAMGGTKTAKGTIMDQLRAAAKRKAPKGPDQPGLLVSAAKKPKTAGAATGAPTAHAEGGPGTGAAELSAWLASAPNAAALSRTTMQLRVSPPSGVSHHLVVSGATSVWKMAQFVSTVCGLSNGAPPEYHSQKGKLAPNVAVRVTRPECCTDALISSKRTAAALGGKSATFVGEKKTKVSALFRGDSTGGALVQTAADAAMSVRLVHPDAPTEIKIELVGLVPNKAAYDRPHNEYALPRLVIFTPPGQDGNSPATNAVNRAWQADREPPSQLMLDGDEYCDDSHWNGMRDPMFNDDGSDYTQW